MQIVRYANEERVFFSSIDDANRVYSFSFEDRKNPIQKCRISLQNKVSQLLWDEKTEQLLVQTDKSIESYSPCGSIDEWQHRGSVLQSQQGISICQWCSLSQRDYILVFDGKNKSITEFEWI